MLAVLSPAKNLDFNIRAITRKKSLPTFLADSQLLVDDLARLAPQDISRLMGISDDLGELNARRYAEWSQDPKGAKRAALVFRGDVYLGLSAWNLSERELTSLQRRVRILSGLYGLLKPLDLIHPYRLEMGTSFANPRGRNLYEFWREQVTDALNEELASHRNPVLVNLASDEYFRVVDAGRLDARIVRTRFLNEKDGKPVMMGYVAKRARGLMARHIARGKIETVKGLKAFDLEGYRFDEERSSRDELVFFRTEAERLARLQSN